MRILLFLTTWMTLALADYPQFCTQSCTVSFYGKQRRVYLHIPYSGAGMSGEILMPPVSGGPVSIKAFVPLPYTYTTQFTLTSTSSISATQVKTKPHFNSHFQTVEYPLADAAGNEVIATATMSVSTITISATDSAYFRNGLNILFKMEGPHELSAMELVAMPIAQWNLHGQWWTQQMYFYVFVAVNVALAALYGVFTRCKLWQWSLVFSIAAFSTVAGENLYHAIVAMRRGGSTGEHAYAIACVCLLANIVPALIAMLFMNYGKCRAVAWSVLAILFGTGFLFLAGAGWFVGCGLLIIGGLIRLTQRTLFCKNCVVIQ